LPSSRPVPHFEECKSLFDWFRWKRKTCNENLQADDIHKEWKIVQRVCLDAGES
jgi:hypothetical protein